MKRDYNKIEAIAESMPVYNNQELCDICSIHEARTIYLNCDYKKLYSKHQNGYEEWCKYDDQGLLISGMNKNIFGDENVYKYDTQGNCIYHRVNDDFIYIYEYDKSNNMIHRKDSTGYEEWNTYDDNNRLIRHKNSDGYERVYDYDDNMCLIYINNTDGIEEYYHYDGDGNIIEYKIRGKLN